MNEIFRTTYLFIYWLTQQLCDQLRSTSTKRKRTANEDKKLSIKEARKAKYLY